MSRIESVKRIEGIVGAKRHETDHLGRAVSAEQRVYVLHSKECVASGIDLRECEYSIALDLGINLDVWRDWQDQPVKLIISDEYDDLEPDPVPGNSVQSAADEPEIDEMTRADREQDERDHAFGWPKPDGGE